MAEVYQIPYKYDMKKHRKVSLNSPVKTAFQVGSNEELRVFTINENGILAFSDDKTGEFWCSRPLTVNEDGTLSYNG